MGKEQGNSLMITRTVLSVNLTPVSFSWAWSRQTQQLRSFIPELTQLFVLRIFFLRPSNLLFEPLQGFVIVPLLQMGHGKKAPIQEVAPMPNVDSVLIPFYAGHGDVQAGLQFGQIELTMS